MVLLHPDIAVITAEAFRPCIERLSMLLLLYHNRRICLYSAESKQQCRRCAFMQVYPSVRCLATLHRPCEGIGLLVGQIGTLLARCLTCLQISLINQLTPKGRRGHAHSIRPPQPNVTDKSAHQPALPEVQGFSDGGQLSHSLVTA